MLILIATPRATQVNDFKSFTYDLVIATLNIRQYWLKCA